MFLWLGILAGIDVLAILVVAIRVRKAHARPHANPRPWSFTTLWAFLIPATLIALIVEGPNPPWLHALTLLGCLSFGACIQLTHWLVSQHMRR